MRIVWRIIKGLFYYSTALLLAGVLTVAIFGGIGYYYYQGYYQEYLGVQQQWAKVDDGYTVFANKLNEKIPVIETELKKGNLKDNAQKDELEKKLSIAKKSVSDSIHSMSYVEKYANYPNLLTAASDVQLIIGQLEGNDLGSVGSELTAMKSTINSDQQTYNKLAKQFNQKNGKFPEKIFSDLGTFHAWQEL